MSPQQQNPNGSRFASLGETTQALLLTKLHEIVEQNKMLFTIASLLERHEGDLASHIASIRAGTMTVHWQLRQIHTLLGLAYVPPEDDEDETETDLFDGEEDTPDQML